jgi:hypothetical protein
MALKRGISNKHEHASFCEYDSISHKQIRENPCLRTQSTPHSTHPNRHGVLVTGLSSSPPPRPQQYQPCRAGQCLSRFRQAGSQRPVSDIMHPCLLVPSRAWFQAESVLSARRFRYCLQACDQLRSPRVGAPNQTFSLKILLLSLALSSRRSPSIGLGETPLKLMLDGSAASSSKGFRPSLLSVLPLSSPKPCGGCCGVAARFIE